MLWRPFPSHYRSFHSFIIPAPLRDDIILKSMSFVGKVKMRETIWENLDSKTFPEFPCLLYVSTGEYSRLSVRLSSLSATPTFLGSLYLWRQYTRAATEFNSTDLIFRNKTSHWRSIYFVTRNIHKIFVTSRCFSREVNNFLFFKWHLNKVSRSWKSSSKCWIVYNPGCD